MLEQNAIVLKTEGEKAWVEARESGTCGSCGSGGCSTRRLADLFGRRERAFPVKNTIDARTGDQVVIGIPAGALWQSAFRLYGLPLILMLLGAFLGQHLGGDLASMMAAIAGLGMAFVLQRNWRNTDPWQPVMLRRTGDNNFLVAR